MAPPFKLKKLTKPLSPFKTLVQGSSSKFIIDSPATKDTMPLINDQDIDDWVFITTEESLLSEAPVKSVMVDEGSDSKVKTSPTTSRTGKSAKPTPSWQREILPEANMFGPMDWALESMAQEAEEVQRTPRLVEGVAKRVAPVGVVSVA